jgi:tetratricopeptide (TPR) repeat protein
VLFVTIGFTAPETVEAWEPAFAYSAQLIVRFNRGDLVEVEEHFARISGFSEAAGFRQFPGAVSTMFWASLSAWILGHADSARERSAHASAVALDRKNPYDLAVGRFYESWLCRWLREPKQAEAAATQALALSEQHGFSNLRGIALVNLGWARAQLGSAREGVSLIRKGLAGLVEIGARLCFTDFLTCLAETQALDGKIDEALITVEEALQANPGEVVWRPNTLTCRGGLRLKTGHADLAGGRLSRSDRTRPEDGCEGLGLACDDESRATAKIAGKAP